MRASCSDEAGLGMPRSPVLITSTALERQVVRLHRLSSATGKRAFDVAQRNSALGQRTTDEGETAGRSASLLGILMTAKSWARSALPAGLYRRLGGAAQAASAVRIASALLSCPRPRPARRKQ